MGDTRIIRSISMGGSDVLSWDYIDKYAKEHGFTTTSGFIQYAMEKEIYGYKTRIKDKIVYITMLLMLAMCAMLILILIR